MHAAAVRVEVRIPACNSLKEKRRRLRPILDHLRKRMELSVSEVDHHDAWQRSAIGIALVAPQAGRLDEVVEGVRRFFLAHDDVDLVDFEISYLERP
jgi:uncharacterized protein YlxP (DUF503 family)